MKTTYFSTFITGWEDIIGAVLPRALKQAKIILLADGLVVYETTSHRQAVAHLPFFNNSFVLLHSFKKIGKDPMKEMLRYVVSNPKITRRIPSLMGSKKSTFRIITSQENHLVATDPTLIRALERQIESTGVLLSNRTKPRSEFWFLARRENYGFFGMRFTHHENYEKVLQKGELRPELAYLLCLLSEPTLHDIFLDPFAGSGAIPLARTNFASQKIIASDNNASVVERLFKRFRTIKQKVWIEKMDAIHMPIPPASITTIVTDPPWGIHEATEVNYQEFYTDMLIEFYRVLKSGGVAIVVVSQKELFEEIVGKIQNMFVLDKKYTTLINGQKVGVYKLIKISIKNNL